MESIPYKREFINPDELWSNLVSMDLTEFSNGGGPRRYGWSSIPRGNRWCYRSKFTTMVVKDEAYERVDNLVGYFSDEQRLNANRKGQPSPFEFYNRNYNRLLAQAKGSFAKDPSKPLRYWLREEIYYSKKECTTFKASVTKALFKHLKSKKVLDPSAGWGDRLLGAAGYGVEVYKGVDPNRSMRPAYDEMIGFIKAKGVTGKYSVVTDDFLTADVGEGYDTVFTSPPYFHYEMYSEDPEQSIIQFTTNDEWNDNFFIPYLTKAYNALIKGGYFCMYICDINGAKYVEVMCKHLNVNLKAKFLGVIAVTPEDYSHAYPIWVWKK